MGGEDCYSPTPHFLISPSPTSLPGGFHWRRGSTAVVGAGDVAGFAGAFAVVHELVGGAEHVGEVVGGLGDADGEDADAGGDLNRYAGGQGQDQAVQGGGDVRSVA